MGAEIKASSDKASSDEAKGCAGFRILDWSRGRYRAEIQGPGGAWASADQAEDANTDA